MGHGSQQEIPAAQSPLTAAHLGTTDPAHILPPRPPPAIPDHDLLRCIGRGSYGEVWLARNIMGTYRAVKIVYRATFDSDRPYEREFKGLQKFEPLSRTHESQVAVLHVGRNDRNGYFFHVMELADDQHLGQQIDPSRYTPRTLSSELRAAGRLPPEQCLQLGLALTTALDHLHEHGLIHRDIKPSNIIYVNGRPKLADIGLVAMVDATCSFVGTEGYLPPEGPGTPQADLYSLGKVLYEASTGQDRRDFPELPAQLDSLQEEKGILELNAVVVKACKPLVQQRYQSAREMHDDLLLLVAGKSVRQTHAMERRLRLVTRAGLVLLAVLVLGAVPYYLAIREAWLARANANKALSEAVMKREVAQLLQDILESVGPSVALGRDTALLKEVMDKAAKRIGSDLTNQPGVEAELRDTIGEVRYALGQYDQATEMHRRALSLREKLSEGQDEDVAESLHNLAKALLALGQAGEAETAQQRALALRQKLFGDDNAEVAASLSGLGRILFKQGRRAESESAFRAALATRERLFGSGHSSLAPSLNDLASVLFVQGRLAEAEATYRDSLVLLRKSPNDAYPELVQTLNDLADVLVEEAAAARDAPKFAEAQTLLREALSMCRKFLGNAHPLVERTLSQLVKELGREGDLASAEALRREDLDLAIREFGSEHPNVALKRCSLAGALRAQGRLAEAQELEQSAVGTARSLAGPAPAKAETIIVHLASVFSEQKQTSEAEALYREALANARMATPNQPLRLERRLVDLADCLKSQHRLAEAEPLLREALASARRCATKASDLPRLENRVGQLGELLFAEGKLAEAEPLLRETLDLKKRRVGNEARDVAQMLVGLASVLKGEGKLREAEGAFREAAAMAKRTAGKDNPEDVAMALYCLVWVLQSEQNRAEAESVAREVLAIRLHENAKPPNERAIADSFFQLASVLWSEGRLAEAESAAREALERYEKSSPNDWQRFNCANTLGGILNGEKKRAEAEVALRDAVAVAKRVANDSHAGDLAQALYSLAWVLQIEDKLPDAEDAAREALVIRRKLEAQGHERQEVADSLYELAVVLQSQREWAQAEVPARECLARYEKMIPNEWPTFNCRSTLGLILLSQHKYTEAEALLLSAYSGLSQLHGTFPIDMEARVREALERLVALNEATSRPAQAAEWRLRLSALDHPPPPPKVPSETKSLQASAAAARRSP
jgi:tetratricopeptide (TPR) repeat protein